MTKRKPKEEKKIVIDLTVTDEQYFCAQQKQAMKALYAVRHLAYFAIETQACNELEDCLENIEKLRMMLDNAKLQVLAQQAILATIDLKAMKAAAAKAESSMEVKLAK